MNALGTSWGRAIALAASLALGPSVAHGNVSTSLSGSTLVVTGDSSRDTVAIQAVPQGVLVVGSAGTLVDGSSDAITVRGVEKITVQLGQGGDHLTLDGLIVPQGLDLQLGRGNDIVELRDVFAGNVRIQTGTGDDAVFVSGPSSFDRLSVQTGSGNDSVVLVGLLVRGTLNVDTAADRDDVQIIGTQVGDDLNVHLGSNDDVLVVQAVIVNRDVNLDGDDGDDALIIVDYLSYGDDLDIDGFGDDWWGWW